MSELKVYKLQLNSKNNRKNGFYLYTPIVYGGGSYYWCESIKSDKVLKVKDVNVYSLVITREIPKEYYNANEIK